MQVNPGQPYNPYRQHEFAPVPVEVMASTILSASQKIVLAALIKRAGKDAACYPSQERLADDCGMTRDQVRYALKNLLKEGFIRINRRYVGSNGYEFLWHTTYCDGESFTQGVGNSQGLGNGSPLKESIKEELTGTHLVVVKKKRPSRDNETHCTQCDDTGWRSVTRNGIDAVERCTHARG